MSTFYVCFDENDSNNRNSWVDSLLILCTKLKNIDCFVTIFGIIPGSLKDKIGWQAIVGTLLAIAGVAILFLT